MLNDIQMEILKLKKENDICILAHSYQTCDILEIADFTGDSFALSKLAKTAPNKTVVMCGVRFMAETCKLLSPKKKVILSSPNAGCPMAEQLTPEIIVEYKKQHPNTCVVAYINTTAALKNVCDVCVTSSSALQIVKAIESEEILFIPDQNLGAYVQKNVPDKKITLMNGGCPIHGTIPEEAAVKAKADHPGALLLVHPECIPDVVQHADFVGSTAAIMEYAKKSDNKEFIIGTELAIVQKLQLDCPDKSFYIMSKNLICPDMKLTSLTDVLNCVKGVGGEEIILDDYTMQHALVPIEKMLQLG